MRYILVSIFLVSFFMFIVLAAHAKADTAPNTLLTCATHDEPVLYTFTLKKAFWNPPARGILTAGQYTAKNLRCRGWNSLRDRPIIPLLDMADVRESWLCGEPVPAINHPYFLEIVQSLNSGKMIAYAVQDGDLRAILYCQ